MNGQTVFNTTSPALRAPSTLNQSPHVSATSKEAAHSTSQHRPPTGVKSADILRGQKTVEITHNGLTYRLQATRLGKLILTK